MFLTRKWLSNYIDIKTIKDEQITIALNSLGFEVDSFKNYSKLNDNLTLGHVGSAAKIEGTHLKHCFVDLGEDLVSTIICGAENVTEEMYVLVATPGCKIANGLKIEKRKIQDRQSEGMICALNEIGLDNSALTEKEADSIYPVVLKEDMYKYIGDKSILEVIGFKDSVWEVDLTLNRSDALSAFQLVKELANYFDIEINDIKKFYIPKLNDKKIELKYKEESSAKGVTTFLSANSVNVKKVSEITPTPLQIYSNQDIWLKFNGIKTTDNFFNDLSNIIAVESGMNVLFLDKSKINKEIIIKNNPKVKDTVNYELYCGDKLISTIGKGVEEQFQPTKDSEEIIMLYIQLNNIEMRKQQKSLNISTPSIQRFMKPISSNTFEIAKSLSVYWLDQYNLYNTESKSVTLVSNDIKDNKVQMTLKEINEILGFELTTKQIQGLFRELDFEVKVDTKETLTFVYDKNRLDISTKNDIIEEIARLYGYDKIPSKPLIQFSQNKSKKMNLKIQNNIETLLLGQQFNNIKTYSLTSKENNTNWNLFEYKNPITLLSPLSQNKEQYRFSLVPSIIEAAQFNANRGAQNLKLYEFADVYTMDDKRERHISLLTSGHILDDNAHLFKFKSSFGYIKGLVESLLNMYQIHDEVEYIFEEKDSDSKMHPYMKTKVMLKNIHLGWIFKLNPNFESSLKLKDIFIAELNISRLEEKANYKIKYKPISKYQQSTRDISILLKADHKIAHLLKDMIKGVKYIIDFKVVDVYSSDEMLEKGERSVSISFYFNIDEKQLSSEDVNKEWEILLTNTSKLGIEIR